MGVHHRGVVKGSGRFTLRALAGDETHFSWDEQLTFPWWLGGPLGGGCPEFRRTSVAAR